MEDNKMTIEKLRLIKKLLKQDMKISQIASKTKIAKSDIKLLKNCFNDNNYPRSVGLFESMRFVAEWNARSSKDGLKRYIDEQRKEAAEEAVRKVKKEAKKQRRIEIATNMCKDGMDTNIIAKSTGLSITEVNKLKNKLNNK